MKMRFRRRLAGAAPPLALALSLAAASGGCTTVAHVTNFPDARCSRDFEEQLSSILREEGETAGTASALARETADALAAHDMGPRPFLVSSDSGADYTFFVQKKSRCLLRLYARQKGFVRYTNNLTYIATRELGDCACAP